MTKIGRIKGANSDYQYSPQAQQIVETAIDDSKNPVELSIFVCPHRQPSIVEQHTDGKYCVGTDNDCPSGTTNGHALLKLHQDNGVLLEAQKSKLTVAENITLTPQDSGKIQLSGALELPEKVYLKNKIEIQANESISSNPLALTLTLNPQSLAISIDPSDNSTSLPSGKASDSHHADLPANSPSNSFQIKLSTNNITLSGPNQSRIVLAQDGTITLTPGGTTNVKVDGNLEVTKALILPTGNITSTNHSLTFNATSIIPSPPPSS